MLIYCDGKNAGKLKTTFCPENVTERNDLELCYQSFILNFNDASRRSHPEVWCHHTTRNLQVGWH